MNPITTIHHNKKKSDELLFQDHHAYHKAWEQFHRVGGRLPKLWRTKKTSAQILREGKNRPTA